ncbi:helix-turn-helix transcriptional regulator [Heyndrickxia oleronia]|uniref:helix-turn-helix transcriptional regulator n=1 Tax=Heyndrickxia oleronia TaxID=38875 RepID=UPI00203EDAF6|nr:helix-turn-helix transcriptional regulator [Heyndrickxia oleronia]MCM3456557.1 helix-turn-helix transcriptional regulator [Heyndrickxia oleronia]
MFWGVGKKRSKVGKLIDRTGYTQEDLAKVSKVSRNTVSKICSDPDYLPSGVVIKKIMKAIKQIDPNAKTEDYFDL